MRRQNTSDRIVQAAFHLFSEKSYQSVSTKEIAKEAGVSEMTLFRHFDNKRNLFEKAYHKFVFHPNISLIFEQEISGELENVLIKISQSLQETFAKNKQLILMTIKELDLASDYDHPLFKFPVELKKLLTEYFVKKQQESIILGQPEVLAIQFLTSNFGLFMATTLMPDYIEGHTIHNLLTENTLVFIRGISK